MKRLLGMISLVALLLLLPVLPVASQSHADRYAVIVAYDNHGSCRVFASTCGRLLKTVLVDNGFSQKNIKFLSGNKATKVNVVEAFEWLDSVENESTEVVVAFFGHGSFNYVALRGVGIWHFEIRDLLSTLESEKQLVIIDTCKSGGAIIPGIDGVTINATNRIVLTSVSSEFGSSVFSGHITDWCYAVLKYGLLEGKADFNGDGKVSIEEAGSLKGGMSDGYEGEFFL